MFLKLLKIYLYSCTASESQKKSLRLSRCFQKMQLQLAKCTTDFFLAVQEHFIVYCWCKQVKLFVFLLSLTGTCSNVHNCPICLLTKMGEEGLCKLVHYFKGMWYSCQRQLVGKKWLYSSPKIPVHVLNGECVVNRETGIYIQVKVTIRQSVSSLSWCQVQSVSCDQILAFLRSFLTVDGGVSSLTRQLVYPLSKVMVSSIYAQYSHFYINTLCTDHPFFKGIRHYQTHINLKDTVGEHHVHLTCKCLS